MAQQMLLLNMLDNSSPSSSAFNRTAAQYRLGALERQAPCTQHDTAHTFVLLPHSAAAAAATGEHCAGVLRPGLPAAPMEQLSCTQHDTAHTFHCCHVLPLPLLPLQQVNIVLEYCDWGCLRDALDAGAFYSGGSLNYAAILDTAADVAKAMLHLHCNQVGPANI
jgi:serine/threonine protein kinase